MNTQNLITNYDIGLKETHIRLSPDNKIKNFLNLKKRRFVHFLIISIRVDKKLARNNLSKWQTVY